MQTKVLSPFIAMYIPCSESAKNEFVKRFHPKLNKVTAISNGVNCEKLRRMSVRKNENVITAVSVGRFTNQKNLHVTAEAFSKITSKDFCLQNFRRWRNEATDCKAVGDSKKWNFVVWYRGRILLRK